MLTTKTSSAVPIPTLLWIINLFMGHLKEVRTGLIKNTHIIEEQVHLAERILSIITSVI